MKTTKKELSYFRLKLENYLSEHFPEMMSDTPFITARADEALTTYCDVRCQTKVHNLRRCRQLKVIPQKSPTNSPNNSVR